MWNAAEVGFERLMRRFWLSCATGPITRAFSAHTVNSTPQRATRRLGKHERTTGVNNVSFASEEHTKRLLSIDVFEGAIGVRFELCGKEAGPRWHEWIQEVGLYAVGSQLPRIGAGTGSFYDPASEALIVYVWFQRPSGLATDDLSLEVGTNRYSLEAV